MRLSLLTLLLLGCVVRHGAPIPAGTPSTQVDWVGLKDYPFESRFLAVDGGQMHYIDEGKGEPVVFVHGTPSWSYEWRGLVSALRADHRCIAMDHIGFGLSEKPAAWGYKPEDHARNLDALLTRLDLRDITLVVHDFGGPIGLSYALAHPERVKRVVVINSWMWSLSDNSQAQKADKLLRGPLGPLLYKDRNLSPRRLMPWALKGELSEAEAAAALGPFPTPESREGLYQMGLGLVGSSAWYDGLWGQRDKLSATPMLVVWGEADPTFSVNEMARWRAAFPAATVVPLPEVGHWPQITAPEATLRALQAFLAPPPPPEAPKPLEPQPVKVPEAPKPLEPQPVKVPEAPKPLEPQPVKVPEPAPAPKGG